MPLPPTTKGGGSSIPGETNSPSTPPPPATLPPASAAATLCLSLSHSCCSLAPLLSLCLRLELPSQGVPGRLPSPSPSVPGPAVVALLLLPDLQGASPVASLSLGGPREGLAAAGPIQGGRKAPPGGDDKAAAELGSILPVILLVAGLPADRATLPVLLPLLPLLGSMLLAGSVMRLLLTLLAPVSLPLQLAGLLPAAVAAPLEPGPAAAAVGCCVGTRLPWLPRWRKGCVCALGGEGGDTYSGGAGTAKERGCAATTPATPASITLAPSSACDSSCKPLSAGSVPLSSRGRLGAAAEGPK